MASLLVISVVVAPRVWFVVADLVLDRVPVPCRDVAGTRRRGRPARDGRAAAAI